MALLTSVYIGSITILNRLLAADTRVDPSVCENVAVRFAAASGYFDIVERLMRDDRVDPSACGNEALVMAEKNGHWRIARLLNKDKRVAPPISYQFSFFGGAV